MEAALSNPPVSHPARCSRGATHDRWRIVLMNADGSRAVTADVSVGARLPHLLTIAIAVSGSRILLLVLGGGALYAAVRRRG